MAQKEESGEERPSVAYFAELDGHATPFLTALGEVVVAVAAHPSPVSVAAGHYCQGPIGQRFWQRLQRVAVIEKTGTGRQNDAAFLAGIGFTDIVKRPTTRADAISAAEFEHGRELLPRSCADTAPPF